MNIKQLARIFFLSKSTSSYDSEWKNREELVQLWYNFEKDTFTADLNDLNNDEKNQFLEYILEIADEYDMSDKDKAMTLHSCLWNFGSRIWLMSIPRKEFPKYMKDPLYQFPLTRPELYDMALIVAHRAVELYPETDFMRYLIEQHTRIEV